ncbi:MAG: DUF2292 domain-containing protein [Armatimonadetes bacterium]|nr:DUF2292 domain-containing protein [Armatimonadota bacterium]
MSSKETAKLPPDKQHQIAIEEVRRALKGLRYGHVTIVVQDGVVVQVERTSKLRLDYSTMQVSGGEGI